MENSITVNMTFYFKGEKLELSTTIVLDAYIEKGNSIPPFYTLLARSNNIDVYSYEYEIMQQENVTFTQAEGLAKEFLDNGVFDHEGFSQKWREEKLLRELVSMVKRNMNIDDINSVPGLKQTLIEVYHLQRNNN